MRTATTHAAMTAAVALALALGLSACKDLPYLTAPAPGSAILETENGLPVTTVLPLDFGVVPLTHPQARAVWLINRGAGILRVESITFASGDESVFGILPALQKVELAPGQRIPLTITFETRRAKDCVGNFAINMQQSQKAVLRFGVKAVAVPDCPTASADPDPADCGTVEIGSDAACELRVLNASSFSTPLTILGIDGPEAQAFEVDSTVIPSTLVLQADSTQSPFSLPLTFRPWRYGTHRATIHFETALGCFFDGNLSGNSEDPDLTCDPAPAAGDSSSTACGLVDFQQSLVGQRAEATLTFKNDGSSPITLVPAGVRQPVGSGPEPVFTFARPTSGSVVVPADGGTAALTLWFQPRELGPFAGTLRLTTGDPLRPLVEVTLEGAGAGPRLVLSEETLTFSGEYATGSIRYLPLNVVNGGCCASPGIADLRLEKPGAESWAEIVDDVEGVFSLTPSVDLDSPHVLPVGVSTRVTVEVMLRKAGRKSASLKIYSNDPLAPPDGTLVRISGEILEVGNCSYRISPTSLVHSEPGACGHPIYLALEVINLGSGSEDYCYVYQLEITAGSDEFTLMQAGDFTLPPADSLSVEVRFQNAVATPGDHFGELSFYVSSPTHPEVRVPMKVSCTD